jgi:predicted nucleic acid-binding protein
VIVVDASALLEVLLQTPSASRIEARLLAPDETLHVPHLIDLEVVHVLRGYEASGEIGAQRGQEAINDLTG